jgi:hypothetical protein
MPSRSTNGLIAATSLRLQRVRRAKRVELGVRGREPQVPHWCEARIDAGLVGKRTQQVARHERQPDVDRGAELRAKTAGRARRAARARLGRTIHDDDA